MIKKNIFIVLMLFCFTANAQEFHGKAEYFCKRIFKNGVDDFGIKPDDTNRKAYEEALKKTSEKKYILTFNQKEALYEQEEVLEKPTSQNGVSVSMVFSGEGKKYINIQNRVKLIEDDIFGKEFLIEGALESYDWKLIDASKKIGEYTCYKAELILPVSEKQKKEYEEYLEKQKTKPSFIPIDEPKVEKITVWYTPEIPVSLGPLTYWGLPGLILEISDERTIILCTKVVLSNKENSKIKIPNVGEKVSKEEFDAIHKAKIESIYER